MTDVYRLKACPHCGRNPSLIKTSIRFEVICEHHPDVAVRSYSLDLSDEELQFVLKDWNDDNSFVLLGADSKAATSRAFFDLTIKVR